MLFKNAFEQQPSLRFVYEKLQFYSALGRQFLLNQPFITDAGALSTEHERLAAVVALWQDTTLRPVFSHLSQQIHQLNNIAPTLSALENGAVLDDIQLFEIKKTAILTNVIAQDVKKLGLTWLEYHPMDEVITILDPEHTFIPHFYVYSAYDEELACLREKMKSENNAQEIETLRFQAQQVEDRLRAELSDKLRPYQEALSKNLRNTAYLDMMIAKVKLAIEWKACRPQISDSHNLVDLINPEIAASLAQKGRKFQPVSIAFGRETVLVTGANMAGKSVLLQSVALAQYLFQFGFFLPAESAALPIVDEIITSIGDRQSALSGLSSFAVEVLTIDRIIKTAREGKRVLALVDELARTTNPDEGKQMVCGFVRTCRKLSLTAIVTTHYSGLDVDCRRLRVKGLQIPQGVDSLSIGHIADYMDYSLIETHNDDVPKEAFTIARLLHVDDEFLTECGSTM
ncbi:MAG: DNA mismatch repair protein MutS [Bacteroidales bacterium]|nr:DNA mismatch repair protein MutS [Bacteroidales bacterium]